jgi:ElaB/YqjD/DUF883 family membrane-anchored ribosome-binding protein
MATTTFGTKGKEEAQAEKTAPTTEENKNPHQSTGTMDKIKEVGGQVADKAKEAIGSVGGMASQAATTLGKKADELAATAGSGIESFAEKMEQQGPHGGVLGQASHTVADALRSSGQYIEEARLSGMAEDVTSMIRRNPVPAVLIGIGIGFLLGRALRS